MPITLFHNEPCKNACFLLPPFTTIIPHAQTQRSGARGVKRVMKTYYNDAGEEVTGAPR